MTPRGVGYEAVERRAWEFALRLLKCTAIAAVALFVLFAIAVPSFHCPPRCNANESAAIATLKNLSSAQQAFRDAHTLDRDHDGVGEFGWFADLTNCDPPQLSKSFRSPRNGTIIRSGYRFRIWLPAATGGWVHGGEGTHSAVDAAERQFRIYAWPDSPASGKRAFFIDEHGDVLEAPNAEHRYAGASCPSPDAAMPRNSVPEALGYENHTGMDGNPWVVVS
jgi:hypothetical protein